ncbi:MAG: caspase family protein, partial [Beijerinckiaceae bacterium]|nr:caspase family protein [Beijerinckiaceae bacterium]
MILRSLRALVVLLASALAVQTAFAQAQPQTQSRFAFVIGNDSYEGAELPTAANDAALVAEMLKSAGFDVSGARNLDQETLRASYREFIEKVAAAGPEAVAFVYVTGYGMQADGENYFIPPGSRIARAADLTLNGVRLTDITRSLGGLPAQARIMVFDIAYQGPFAREGQASPPGLAIMDAGPGDLIAFNASPGAIAPHGTPPYGAFAQALAEMAREPGTPIGDVFDHVRVRVAELT